jgi:TonB family protein
MRLFQVAICVGLLAVGCAVVGQDSANKTAPSGGQTAQSRVRVSEGVMSGALLVKKVAPEYPEDARQKHIKGKVVMEAEISPEGDVERLRALSGDPALVPSALDAAKQWKYKPYVLNGHPVAVETQITINFDH